MALPKPQADPAADSPAAIRDRRVVWRDPASRSRRRGSAARSTQGREDDDFRPHTEARGSPRTRRDPVLSRTAPASFFRELRLNGDGLPRRDRIRAGRRRHRLTPSTRDSRRAERPGPALAIRIAVDDGYMFTVTSRWPTAGGRDRPGLASSAAPAPPRIPTAGRCTSARRLFNAPPIKMGL